MKAILVTISVLVISLVAFGQTPEEKGLAIAQEVDLRDSGWGDWQADVRMVLAGEKRRREIIRQFSFKLLEVEGDGDRSLIVFSLPRDIKGMALLTFAHPYQDGNDDQWLYRARSSRLRRIAATNKSSDFASSEFSYEDFTPQEVSEYSHKYLRDEVIDGQPCLVIESIPLDKKSGYSRQVVWVDQAEYHFRQVVYYDQRGQLFKTLTLTGFKQYDDKWWRPSRMVMTDHKEDKITILEMTEYLFGQGLTKRDFSQLSLSHAR